MGFGETIKRYIHSNNAHGDNNDKGKALYLMDYKRLKGILKNCWANNVAKTTNEPCHFCVEVRRESYEVERCFRYRVKEVVRLHEGRGAEKWIANMRRYFFNDRRQIAKECRRLMQYAADNAAIMHKIVHKYNQVHNCKGAVNRNCESTFGAKSLNILQSPWLKELGALYINLNESNGGKFKDLFTPFSCDLNPADLAITLNLSKSLKLEYSITCPICLFELINYDK
ncbi:PREDICTED: probable E3 ubiquitin-protein ligase BAH1-like [Ipomoea nil]|uniref:probable E3 ubiquitin-protein ligase BAH1-like n=1 Tax=Ipomoea nil TaxID=35883 RepID=UPI00090193A4|nr:PREDICTED: probable E3 ubiquitin-protein ligase BAH1-like [Ipomoea nil]